MQRTTLAMLADEVETYGNRQYAADLRTLDASLAERSEVFNEGIAIGDGDSGEQIMIGPGEVHRLAAAIRAGAVEVADSGAPTITAEGLSATGSRWHRWIMLRE